MKCKPFKDGKGTRAETGEELECDFDSGKGCDCWANHKPPEDQNEWVECKADKIDKEKFEDCFQTKVMPG